MTEPTNVRLKKVKRIPTRVYGAAISTPWAIEEPALMTILSIIQRRNEDPSALAARLGRPLANNRNVIVRDGVAVIPVTGPLLPRVNSLEDISSGATSVEVLALDLEEALASEEVSAILLDVDSPGGAITGIAELATMIAEGRQRKPISAYVGGSAASAAYWLASQADEIVVDRTARLGSIGVVAATRVQKQPDRDGYLDVELVSTSAPNKRPDIESDEGKATILAELDVLEELFIADVARGRGVTPERVRSDFGRGWMLVGENAVAAGMAERVGTFEQLLADLATRQPSETGRPRQAAAQEGETDMDLTTLTMEELAAARPDLVSTIEGQAASKTSAPPQAGSHGPEVVTPSAPAASPAAADPTREAVDRERNRILSIRNAVVPGFEQLADDHIADPEKTAGDYALAVMAEQKKQRSAAATSLASDEAALAKELPAPGASAGGGDDTPAVSTRDPEAIKALAETEWSKNPKLHAEFRSKEAYAAYRQGMAEGRFRVWRGSTEAA